MSKLGYCRTCQFAPIATNAPICPNCGKVNPNPGFLSKWIPRVVVVAFLLMIVAAVIAYNAGGG